MNDLISRQDAISKIREVYEYEFPTASGEFDEFVVSIIPNILRNLPSAEPEYKNGKWIKVEHWRRCYKCNQCGNYLDFDGVNAGRGDENFCPNCGARMTRGDHE